MIAFSCRRVAELTSKELDAKLRLDERFALGFHRLGCAACRRFRTQVGEIDRVLGEYASEASGAEAVRMPHESKARLKDVLRAAAADDGDANPR